MSETFFEIFLKTDKKSGQTKRKVCPLFFKNGREMVKMSMNLQEIEMISKISKKLEKI